MASHTGTNIKTELDYLCAVDDFSRLGALRLRDSRGAFLQSVQAGRRATPPLLELEKILLSSEAVERGTETAEDLRYLQGKGTSLGGMRPVPMWRLCTLPRLPSFDASTEQPRTPAFLT